MQDKKIILEARKALKQARENLGVIEEDVSAYKLTEASCKGMLRRARLSEILLYCTDEVLNLILDRDPDLTWYRLKQESDITRYIKD